MSSLRGSAPLANDRPASCSMAVPHDDHVHVHGVDGAKQADVAATIADPAARDAVCARVIVYDGDAAVAGFGAAEADSVERPAYGSNHSCWLRWLWR